jgi:hypothetical protein
MKFETCTFCEQHVSQWNSEIHNTNYLSVLYQTAYIIQELTANYKVYGVYWELNRIDFR